MIKRIINVDFSRTAGKIKPVNGALSGPKTGVRLQRDFTDEYRLMGIPFARCHNAEFPYGSGQYLDIHCIFPDANADENDEGSYNFAPTDAYLLAIKEAGADVFLRLGESTDPFEYKTYVSPPADPEKWARVCEHIIAHYNEGWACGYKLRIKYFEIWSGADRTDGFSGTAEDYYRLYSTVARRLKARFPGIKLGAYSSGGFFSLNHFNADEVQRSYVAFMQKFFSLLTRKGENTPLDFFSWQCYAETPEELSLHANYAKALLSQFGLRRTQSIVSEFNLASARQGMAHLSREYPSELCASLIIAQKSGIDMMFYSSLDPVRDECAVFSLDDRRTKRYYSAYQVMLAFGKVASLKTAVDISEDYRRELYALASASADEGAVLLVSRNFKGVVDLNLGGSEFTRYSVKGILGGGERGAGFSTEERDLPLSANTVTLRLGSCEVYLITLTK